MPFLSFRLILLTATAALLVAPLLTALAQRAGLLDTPGTHIHKQHARPTPASGGLVLLVVLSATAITLGWWKKPVLAAILAPALVIFAFGMWDDLRSLPPWAKLSGQFLAAVLMVRMGVQVMIFQANWLNLLVTILWMVGITNAFNFVDSKDGLALGLACLAAAFFLMATKNSGQPELSLLSAALLGAGTACFYYNSPPALFFLGDSGSQLLGFLLAGLSISYNPPGYDQLTSWYLPILLMGVPVFDITLVVFSRLRRGLPIYQAGLDHTYHRLVRLGFSASRAVLTMQLAGLLLGYIAFIALGLQPLVANLIFAGLLLTGAALLYYLEKNTP